MQDPAFPSGDLSYDITSRNALCLKLGTICTGNSFLCQHEIPPNALLLIVNSDIENSKPYSKVAV